MKHKFPRKMKKELKKLEIIVEAHPAVDTDPFDTGFRGIAVRGKVNKRTRKVIARVVTEYKRREQLVAQQAFEDMIENALANNNN